MRIFDCFTFYNELDLLEVRLRELYDKVDQFVIVEATTTFTNRPKPLYFDDNHTRYAPWMDKIQHIVVDLPQSANAWDNETAQRNTILHGLNDAEPDDLVIVSDVDEIVRAEAIDAMKSMDQTIYALRMPIFNFKFNYMRVTPGQYDVWAMAARAQVFHDIGPNTLRSLRFNYFDSPYQFSNDGISLIEHAGWHFGYMGNEAYLRDKAQSFSHTEVNRPDFLAQIDVEKSIAERKEWNREQTARYEIVNMTDYFPQAATAYADFVLPNSGFDPLDFLPPFPYNK